MARKRIRVAVLLAGLTLLTTVGISPHTRSAQAQAPTTCANASDADFNGDGRNDLVVGGIASTPSPWAGAVAVMYGGPDGRIGSGPAERLQQGMRGVGGFSEDGDDFGSVLATGHLDSDRCLDLVVGAPQETIGSAEQAGAVYVIFGSPAGLGHGRPGLVLARGQGGVPGPPLSFGYFGSALHVARTPGSTGGAIAIGEPGRTMDRDALIHWDAGNVAVVSMNPNGSVKLGRVFSQDTAGVTGSTEQADHFGYSVALGMVGGNTSRLDLIVGAPGEGIGTVRDGGNVTVIYDAFAAASSFRSVEVRQGLGGITGRAERNDRFGWRLGHVQSGGTGYIAVGVPYEDVFSSVDAGVVQLLSTTNRGLVTRAQVDQNTGGAPGGVERSDRFGEVLALLGPSIAGSGAILSVGVPAEDLNGMADAGLMQSFRLPAASHLSTVDEDHPGGLGVEAGTLLGYAVSGARTTAETSLIATTPFRPSDSATGMTLFPLDGGTARTVTDLAIPNPSSNIGFSIAAHPYVPAADPDAIFSTNDD
jgi:hypothetical protein